MTPQSIFLSSVQKELTDERRAVKAFVEGDPLLRRFFTVFLFEDLPARDRRADEVYLAEVDRCALYVGLFGQRYGFEDAEGVSPTEREFDRATTQGKARLIFVKGADDKGRHSKMQALIRKAGAQLIRRRFGSMPELTAALYASLVDHLENHGVIQLRSFEERLCPDATLADLDGDAVKDFVRRARYERQFPLPEHAPVTEVLAHLNLLREAAPSNAALLLFGRNPQQFIPCAEVRCMHFHGTDVQRPAPSYQIFKGRVFEQMDHAANFVLSVIDRRVGTREHSPQAPVSYEIPPDVLREAIVNAVAHRDYTSAASVQVSVFADRVEVWNPGSLPPELTPARLREPHASVARNPRICEALFLARYIEKYGTGTLMMIRMSAAHGLPEPDFEQRGSEFVTTIWREWLTDKIVNALNLNDRQRTALDFARTHRRIDNASLRKLTGAIYRTASRDLEDLVRKGVLKKVGRTGRSAHYVLARKQDINRTNRTIVLSKKQDKNRTNGTPETERTRVSKAPPAHKPKSKKRRRPTRRSSH